MSNYGILRGTTATGVDMMGRKKKGTRRAKNPRDINSIAEVLKRQEKAIEPENCCEQKVAPCWDGYVQSGMKKGKKGKLVPNCVPVNVKSVIEDINSENQFAGSMQWEDYSQDQLNEIFSDYEEKSLDKWFKEKWVDISRPKKGGGFEPCGRSNADGGKYPKCVPASRAAKMTQEEIASAVRRKRRAESTETRVDKKPIYVSTEKKDFELFDVEGKAAIPTNPELYARVKAEAKRKFDVYPSAYANAWLVREYKKRGGGYRTGEKDANDSEVLQKGAKKPRLRDPKGGLTAAGRAHFKRTEGANLKPGVKGAADTPEKMRRKGSFLTRFFTNPSGPMKDDNGKPTRLALSAAAWGEPVPQDASDAAALAAKGRRMLERYQNSKKKK